MKVLINFFTPEDQEPQKDLLYAEVILGFEGTVQEVQESFHWCDWYVDSIIYEAPKSEQSEDFVPKRIEVTSVRVLS
jgi:hypothetical protein